MRMRPDQTGTKAKQNIRKEINFEIDDEREWAENEYRFNILENGDFDDSFYPFDFEVFEELETFDGIGLLEDMGGNTIEETCVPAILN